MPTDSVKTKPDNLTRFMPLLIEIQRKVYILLITMVISGVLGFIYYQKILSAILKFFNLKGITVVLTNPYQFYDLAFNTGLCLGVIVCLPLLIFFVLQFLKPALSKKEFRIIQILVPASILLFICGFAFGAWIMQFVVMVYKQTTVDFNVSNFWDIGHFFAQIIILGLCMGLVFQLPIVITILLRLKLIKKELLTRQRRIFYAAIMIFAVLLPPNDILSLSLLTLVPIFLFEIAILLN